MKKIGLLSMLFMGLSMATMAEENHLYIQLNGGETQNWSIPSLQNITFQNGQVVLNTKKGSSIYTPIASIGKMYITTPSLNGMDVIEKNDGYEWNGELLKVHAQEGALLKVYSTSGATVYQQHLSGNAVDLHWLSKGLYIVNIDGKAFKILKK